METYLEPVQPVSPLAPYMGGKRLLAPKIIERIGQIPHTVYAEPFIGMGGIFFRRTHRPTSEIINDRNGDVVTLFRILQRHYPAFLDHLKFQLTSRREFERLSRVDPSTLTDLERAARFLYLQRTAYGGKVTGQNFGVSSGRPARFDYTQIGPALEDVYERLAGVVIENLDWAEVIDRYDGPSTLFYLDPPYWDCEDDYGSGLFDREQFDKMAERLERLQGKAIVSLNDTPGVRRTFGNFRTEAVDLTYSIGQASGGPKAVGEVLIYTFPEPSLPLFG
ncbi:DNA adenine methylase [Pelagibacterium nitratireducens]|uniref:site-specific DNA-methyltransferase (adenine-specific) n=1 Tax=Pelagibacterium nitratireducens TaxID=1046114 RepID=A0ABZ2HW64_9HYPH